jgi:uroporphyrinogen decarboxylase
MSDVKTSPAEEPAVLREIARIRADDEARTGLTPKQQFIMALERKTPPGLVPHMELVFFLTEELLGQKHPLHMDWTGWEEKSDAEKEKRRRLCARIYADSTEKLGQSAVFLHAPGGIQDHIRMTEIIREEYGDRFFIMVHGDATYSIPGGERYLEFVYMLQDRPEEAKEKAAAMVETALERGRALVDGGIDGFALCADYCFNQNPFMPPDWFAVFVAPYLTRLCTEYRKMGAYVIKHTDGNIMPILDQLVAAGPHALHSLDPQARVDIRQVKEMVGDQVCLIGNVNCGLLQTGTEEEVRESAGYALRWGMPGGGYIFATSNCIYPGLPLERYMIMLEEWTKHGRYQ